MRRVVINIRASKNISGLVKVSVTSPAGLMQFFLNVEPCRVILIKVFRSMEGFVLMKIGISPCATTILPIALFTKVQLFNI